MLARAVFVAAVAAALLSVTAAGPTAVGSKRFGPENRYAPSGVVSVDPAGAVVHAPLGVVPSSVAGTSGCKDRSRANVRANQECTNQARPDLLGRGQSQNETAVAVNPRDAQNVVIGQNDYRGGDSGCGVDWTRDGGRHWGSTVLPSTFTSPGLHAARHYWEAAGDPTVAFDSRGVAYYACLVFDRGSTSDSGSNASGLLLFRSADGGASWSFPGSVIGQTGGNGAIGLFDKQYMAIDTNPHSRFRDRIYVAWDHYNHAFTADPVHLAWSDDAGATWHQSGDIVPRSRSLCPVNGASLPAGTCSSNFAPDPFVAPDGALYVVFANGNNCSGANGCRSDRRDNHNQILIVKSVDGGRTFSGPVKVADYYDLPDCVTYTGHDAGSPCVPTAPLSDRSIFRASNYPSGTVARGRIVVSFGSYINRHSNPARGNCRPAGISATTFLNLFDGVGRVGGCNNDIVVSVSTNGGASFTGTHARVDRLQTASTESRSGPLADQWFQWTASAPGGVAVTSFYDRMYGSDQRTGAMDVSLRTATGVRRVTDVHLPPSNEFPDPGSRFSDFMGDYTGVAVGTDGVVHPAWADTRNAIRTFEIRDPRRLVAAGHGADIYTAAVR
jgi:hypothetical protein